MDTAAWDDPMEVLPSDRGRSKSGSPSGKAG